MAKGLKEGDRVYVPWARLGNPGDKPSALHYTTVRTVAKRSITVDLPGGQSGVVASSAALKNIGTAVVRLGDFDTERGLLDPLAKSILQFLRLLHTDDSFTTIFEARTLDELGHFWSTNGAALSHVVLVGHGKSDGIRFGTNDKSALEIGEVIGNSTHPKIFLSLCCHTGRAAFAKPFSMLAGCEALIAPFNSIHGAVASQFCQTFFTSNLLSGRTTKVAFKETHHGVQGKNVLRLWQNGRQQTLARVSQP